MIHGKVPGADAPVDLVGMRHYRSALSTMAYWVHRVTRPPQSSPPRTNPASSHCPAMQEGVVNRQRSVSARCERHDKVIALGRYESDWLSQLVDGVARRREQWL